MSTAAFDGKLLVTDSAIHTGGQISPSEFRKIYTPEENEYWEICGVKAIAFALVGTPIVYPQFRKVLQEGMDHSSDATVFDGSFEAIVVGENGAGYQIILAESNKDVKKQILQIVPATGFLAVGDGDQFALAVMSVGKSARVGVKAAINLCIESGGNLQVFEVPPPPETPSVRPTATKTAETIEKLEQAVGELEKLTGDVKVTKF
jgi:hypothetical protein